MNTSVSMSGRGGDVVDFLEGQLAGQHHAGEAEPVQGLGPGAVVDRQLRAGVQFQLGEVLPGQAVDAQVLQDERIDADVARGRPGPRPARPVRPGGSAC